MPNQQEASTSVAQEQQPVNRDGTQEELPNQERRTGIVEAIVAEQSKMILNQENININKGGPEPPLYSLLGEDISTDNSKIYRAAIRNNWDSAKDILEQDKEKLKAKLSPSGDTALHIAVGTNSSHDFVKEIVKMIIEKFDKQGLHIRNRYGDTVLHIAARVGNRRAAELLVREDPQMLELTNTKNHMPIWLAAWGNDAETLHYLLSVTIKQDVELARQNFCSEPKDDSKFLFVCIRSDHYDVALYLIKEYPELVWENCGEGTPLMTLASKPDSFRSGLCLRYTEYYWFYEFIYSWIPISADDESLSYKMPDTREDPTATIWKVYLLRILRMLTFLPLMLVYPIVNLVESEMHYKGTAPRETKTQEGRTTCSKNLLNAIREAPLEEIDVYGCVLGPAIYAAIQNGCIELLEKCIEEYPGAIWCTGRNYSFFALAIKHRQEEVFNLIYQMSAYKIHMLNHRENLQNALHAAGELPPYNRLNTVTGPALQLQRELLWFQKVEEFSETSSLHFRNKKNMTPKMLFTEQHKDLLREAQEWTKATTASSTVVAALIVTITFAAIFTAPGGYEGGDDKKGTPVFLGRKLFQIFVFTDTAALFFSATSVLSFLSTLTCLSQEDFLSAVPWRLTIGFISLYVSLVATVLAFGAALVLVLYSKIHWIKTMVITVGCLPIILNSWWQFPLFLELLRGTVWLTFGKSIFRKRKDSLVH